MKTIKSSVSLFALAKGISNASAKINTLNPFSTFAVVSMLAGVTLMGMSGCQPQSTEAMSQPQIPKLNEMVGVEMPKNVAEEMASTVKNTHNHSHDFKPQVTQPVAIDNNAELQAKKIVESLRLNQARLAAKTHDKCPKLVMPTVDSNQIVRNHELLKAKYCDYYIYPKQGEFLSVETNPSSLQSELVTPSLHDFKNGSYRVEDSNKHVVRIMSTNNEQMTTPIEYDVSMTLQGL